jgi:Na+/H+-translocating membrane pyrophosphatase
VALGISLTCLPEVFHLPTPSKDPAQEEFKVVKNLYMFVCVACGLWGGLLIGLQTEYFTSNAFKPVQVGGDRRVCATVPFATGATVSYHTHQAAGCACVSLVCVCAFADMLLVGVGAGIARVREQVCCGGMVHAAVGGSLKFMAPWGACSCRRFLVSSWLSVSLVQTRKRLQLHAPRAL